MLRSKHNFTFNISYSPDKLDKILQKHIGKCNETSKLMGGGVTRKSKKWESREPHRCGKHYRFKLFTSTFLRWFGLMANSLLFE